MEAEKLPDVLTVPEAARFLRVSPRTVYNMAKAGKLPGAHRLGRSVRVHRRSMLQWLADGKPSH